MESTDPLANSCHSKRGEISIISGGVSDGVSERHNTASHLKALSALISSTDKQVLPVRQRAALCGCGCSWERDDLLREALDSKTLLWALQNALGMLR